jgi:hypothetical protein
MCLYRVVLNPFLGMLDRDLTRLRVAEEDKSHALSLRRRSTDIEKLRKITKIQEQPSEATLHSRKSKALDRMWRYIWRSVRGRDQTPGPDISGQNCWIDLQHVVIDTKKNQKTGTYCLLERNLTQWAKFVHAYLLSIFWHCQYYSRIACL